MKVFDHITRPVRPDDAEAFAGMSASTKYSDLDSKHKRYREDIFTDKYKRLDENELSRTITAHIAKDGYWYIHPRQERTLTVREAARIQTFGDHVRFAGPPSSAFRQIGNAVPPLLGEHLGRAIRQAWVKGERPRSTTQLVSEELANWFDDRPPIAVPWLASGNPVAGYPSRHAPVPRTFRHGPEPLAGHPSMEAPVRHSRRMHRS